MSVVDGNPHWDYTALAPHYELRPDYDEALLQRVLASFRLQPASRLLDVGAGTGKLTRVLAATGCAVLACEPNAAMRTIGRQAVADPAVRWLAGCGQALPVRDASVDLVGYGSSLNVLQPALAAGEAARVLRPGGHWLAVWNHRDLDDPLQREVEDRIRGLVSGFDPGLRRSRDPAAALSRHAAFDPVQQAQTRFVVTVEADAWLRAWRSHATLQRQAGAAFDAVLEQLAALLDGQRRLDVPYFSRAWWARRR